MELLLGWGGRQIEWTAEVLMLWSPSFQGQPRRLPTSLPSSVHLHHLALSFWDFLFFPRVDTEWESYLKGAHCHSGFLWFRQAAWAFLQLCSKLELKGGPWRLLSFYKSKNSRPEEEADSPRQNLHWTWVVFLSDTGTVRITRKYWSLSIPAALAC